VPREHVADLGDAAGWAADHGQSVPRLPPGASARHKTPGSDSRDPRLVHVGRGENGSVLVRDIEPQVSFCMVWKGRANV
jgi:hypothetical protein